MAPRFSYRRGEMLRLIKALFTGDWHLHEWETIDIHEWVDDWREPHIKYYSRCKHCGMIKSFEN